jgi:hypothetical protein
MTESTFVETGPFDSPFQQLRHKRTGLAEAPVVSLVVKSPASGQSGLTTQTSYNAMLEPVTVTYPDSTSMTNFYALDGSVAQTSGSRVYPAGYGYDWQGRQTSLTTWTNFAAGAGAASSTNNYDPYRGWLDSKVYEDGTQTLYVYTPAGRLWNRAGVSPHY